MQTRQQNSYFRDLTFHVNRRKFGYNIPATDLDFLEYDNFQPIDLREFKNKKSGWREGNRTASVRAVYNLAKCANIPFYVIEHNDNYSEITVCFIEGWNEGIPQLSEQTMTLPDYVSSLYKIRNRDVPETILIPESLSSIILPHLIYYLVRELKPNERLVLLKNLVRYYKFNGEDND